MNDRDVYAGLGYDWVFPNRRRDIDYASMTADEVRELDRMCASEGWVGQDLKECARGWFEAKPGSSVGLMAAHSWHRAMECLDVWPDYPKLGLDVNSWIECRDAASMTMYTSICSVEEARRMLWGAVGRGRSWLDGLWLSSTMGRTTADMAGIDASELGKVAKRYHWAEAELQKAGWGLVAVGEGASSSWAELTVLSLMLPALHSCGDRARKAGNDRVSRRPANQLVHMVERLGTKGIEAMLPVVGRCAGVFGM